MCFLARVQVFECNVCFCIADLADRVCVQNLNIKAKSLRLIVVYAPNNYGDRPDLLRQIEPFLTTSRRAVLAGDWNFVLESDLDRIGEKSDNKNTDVKSFRDFIGKFDHVYQYRNVHPGN